MRILKYIEKKDDLSDRLKERYRAYLEAKEEAEYGIDIEYFEAYESEPCVQIGELELEFTFGIRRWRDE